MSFSGGSLKQHTGLRIPSRRKGVVSREWSTALMEDKRSDHHLWSSSHGRAHVDKMVPLGGSSPGPEQKVVVSVAQLGLTVAITSNFSKQFVRVILCLSHHCVWDVGSNGWFNQFHDTWIISELDRKSPPCSVLHLDTSPTSTLPGPFPSHHPESTQMLSSQR